jgi:hypothetical protein
MMKIVYVIRIEMVPVLTNIESDRSKSGIRWHMMVAEHKAQQPVILVSESSHSMSAMEICTVSSPSRFGPDV